MENGVKFEKVETGEVSSLLTCYVLSECLLILKKLSEIAVNSQKCSQARRLPDAYIVYHNLTLGDCRDAARIVSGETWRDKI